MVGDQEPTAGPDAGRVVVFGPSPLLEVSVEHGPHTDPTIRVIPGGQPVWVSRMVATMGSRAVLCGLCGGETGVLLENLLTAESFTCRLVATTGDAGSFVIDQRGEPATELASAWAPAPSPDEVDALLGAAQDEAADADALVVCNPMPGDALPLDTYSRLVRWADSRRLPVVVDLSTPRLEAALSGGPAYVKLNDWELAELVTAPVDEPGQWHSATDRLLEWGARCVVVTRGAGSAHVVGHDGRSYEVDPPLVGSGRAAGCGDAWTGAFAAVLAQGMAWRDAVVLGMAAGAAHYSGRGESSRAAIERLARQVVIRVAPG